MDPEVTGTATEVEPNDLPETVETTVPEGGATAPTTEPAKVESFFDPSALSPELKEQWKKMHGAYTKRLDGIRAIEGRKPDLDFLDQYRGNPEVARQILQQEAQRLGLTLSTASSANGTANGSAAATTTAKAEGVPAELVKAIEEQLPPELKWMAPAQAAASWAATRLTVGPLVQKDQAKDQAARVAEYDRLAEELSTVAPGWEEHESTINELQTFLRSSALTHPKFGSRLALLHGVVTKDARARVAAAQSMGDAARNRTTTGQSGRSVTPNIAEQVRSAPTNDAAIKIAAANAIESLKAQGITLPA